MAGRSNHSFLLKEEASPNLTGGRRSFTRPWSAASTRCCRSMVVVSGGSVVVECLPATPLQLPL
ncbi:hypothetical protein Hanom_Chr09g00858851 [Helianthus anomalus]